MTFPRRLVPCAALVGALALAPAAGAAGPPLPSWVSGQAGAVAPGGTERFVARPAAGGTAVSVLDRRTGRVVRSRRLPGRWTVPAVALDGATTGLSADGRTLVLVRPEREFPAAKTSLGVVDARRLTVRRTIVLSGAFTVDAVSPDGRTVYVIQYADSVLDYRVRALDARSGRLAARDVVDPRQPGERMAGLPLARASSPDGRWAYTLYGGGDETFVHALDTVGRTAACIDIDALPPDADLSGVRLRVLGGARTLEVRDAGRLVATVDARTFAVHEAVAGSARVRAARESGVPGGGVPWTAILLAGAIGLAALAAASADRRRGRGAPPRTT